MSTYPARSDSPFVEAFSFEAPTVNGARRNGLSSPFVEAFAYDALTTASDASGADRRILLAQLYDEEFDDSVYELMGEAASQLGNGSRLGAGALRLRFEPLAHELESFIDRAAEELGNRDAASFTDSEIDEVLSRVGPERQLAPEFENFFGSLKKAVSRVAKGAVSLAKKGVQAATALGLGPILAKLKSLVRPLLERVLKSAINRLPVALQPAARKLAGNLSALFSSEHDSVESNEEPAVEVGFIQSEFNEQIADLLLRGEESEPTAQSEYGALESAPGIADLDAARERFVTELQQLDDGEDAAPAIEGFVPALLPVLKLGLRLAGRPRVVSVLAGIVSKLISRFVGPASSKALSSALVDSGLKLIGLEVSDSDQQRTAHAAVAATVEETVRRVAALPDDVLDNETLLEGSVLGAFEQAAASNLPPLLSDAVYRKRPDLVETDSRRGTWIQLPIRGAKRYKKFSRVLKTRITPRVAMAVPTFGDAPLAQYLQEQLGLDPGEEVEAQVHLYEALAGTNVGDVARFEANGHGPARGVEFHPLTMEAAALLVREPGLGRPIEGLARTAPRGLAVGQRFYRVEVPGRRVAAVPGTGTGAKGSPRRRTSVHTVLDFPGDKVRLYLFLSERQAQQLAATLRKQGHAGAVATALKGFIDRGVAAATSGNVTGRIRILHEALTLEEARGAALARLPKSSVNAFAGRIGQWTLTALTDFLSGQAARFIAATEDTKDGVTVIVTLTNPPGMAAMRKAVAGAPASGDAAGAPASVQVDVSPGFTNG